MFSNPTELGKSQTPNCGHTLWSYTMVIHYGHARHEYTPPPPLPIRSLIRDLLVLFVVGLWVPEGLIASIPIFVLCCGSFVYFFFFGFPINSVHADVVVGASASGGGSGPAVIL